MNNLFHSSSSSNFYFRYHFETKMQLYARFPNHDNHLSYQFRQSGRNDIKSALGKSGVKSNPEANK
jgi:hypothetical protein